MAIDAAQLRVVVTADTSKAQSELKSFSGSMKNVAGGMAAVGGILSATVAAPLIGIGVSAIKTAASFEKSMNVLGYVTEGTSAQMQAMSDQALQLGADTVFSAGEAAEGMVELGKAGMDTEDIMGAIPGVMDLAAAGQISVAEAAGLTASTLATFSLEAEKSTEVADILAAAANSSTADIRDLAFGVQNAGSVFAASGQSVDTLATLMAILADNGLNASDAATSLKTMTMRLTAPTNEAAKVMNKLGIAVFDADGNMRDYRDIVEDMEIATKGLSDEQRSAAFNTVFGADAIRSALILAKEGVGVYDEVNAKVLEQGAAAEMAAAQNKGLEGAISAISGSLETLQIKLALPFLDTIAGWMEKLAQFVNKLGEIPAPLTGAILIFLGIAGAAGLAMAAISGIAFAIGALETAGIAGIVGTMSAAVLGFALAAAGAYLIWTSNWGGIQESMQPFIEKFQEAKTVTEDFFRYLGTAMAEGDVFNAWLLSIPITLLPFAEAFAGALISVKDFATQTGKLLQNLGQYFLAVVLGAAALNLWLFTLPPQMQAFALSVGEGLVAVQGFATESITALSNLGSYFLAVALGAAALNIWLFTLPTQMQSFALSVGEAIAGIKAKVTELNTALSEIKLPDLSNFGTSKLNTNIQMQLVATVRDLQLDWSTFTWSTGIIVEQIQNELNKITWDGLVVDFKGLMTTIGDRLNAAATAAFGENNIVTRTIQRVGDALTTIQSEFEGLDLSDPLAAVQTVFAMVPTLIDAVGDIKIDVITTAVTTIGKLATAIGDFASEMIDSVDAQALADIAGNLIGGIRDSIVALMSTESKDGVEGGAVGALGEAAGQIVSSLVTQLGNLLGAEKFATDVGTAIGEATVAIAAGALEFAGQFAQALADTDWGQFTAQIATFVGNLVGAMIGSIGPAMIARIVSQSMWNPESAQATQQRSLMSREAQVPFAPGFPRENLVATMPYNSETWTWPEYPPFTWPPFKWPEIPEPPWMGGTGGSAGGGVKPGMLSLRPELAASRQEAITQEPLDWAVYVMPLAWSEFVQSVIWDAYIMRLAWESFVTILEWGSHIPELSWGNYISSVDWGRFIPTAPISQDAPAANASGTPYFKGGQTWVGEQGPELVTLPQGSRIYSNEDSMGMMGTTINVFVDSINSALDIEVLAAQLAKRFQQKMRS